MSLLSATQWTQSALKGVLNLLPVFLAYFFSQTVGSTFCSSLLNSSEHQRQLWTQSIPGSLRWSILLPPLAAAPLLLLQGEGKPYNGSSHPWWEIPLLRAAQLLHSGPELTQCHGLSQQLERGIIPPLSRGQREGRDTRPTKLLHVFEIPFVPGHLTFQSCFQIDWMMMPSMPKEKISSKKEENNHLKSESK